ncbi:c-type cytochrome [Variovorax sp. dw_954]|uniref:c-type cytochrome n=1 Tax=Variovorax sp. dw_954 TaxID=2720078 RepID=UPI001BD42D93|nr:c-type cytochrome [Variovorax sp. dw_954]
MSADPHYQATEEAHTGPIKNPKQLLLAVLFSFVVPIGIIFALVAYVVSGSQPAGAAKTELDLYGVTKEARDKEVADRLQRVGSIEIRDANRPLAQGEVVFKTQCAACHGAPGLPTAPHYGDAAAWGPRIGQGYATLLEHALKGKGVMPPQGGGDFEDLEIGRAVVYMANAGGAKFPVPERPAEGAAPAADGAAAPAAPAAAAPAAATEGAPAAAAAAAPAAAPAATTAEAAPAAAPAPAK